MKQIESLARALLLSTIMIMAGIVSGATLTVQPSAVVVTLHEPVVVDAILTVAGSFSESIELGQEYDKAFRLRVLGPDGLYTSPQPHYGPLDGPGGEVMIGSGDSRTIPLLLNEWLPFNSPGEYRIEISLPDAFPTVSFQVVVLPRDAARLRTTCLDLAEKARSLDFAVSQKAARSLSFVTDDVAVPYLAEIAHSRQFENFAIEGLVRIGSAASVAAIETIIRATKDPAIVLFAAIRLGSFRGLITDESVRKKVDQAMDRAFATTNTPVRP